MHAWVGQKHLNCFMFKCFNKKKRFKVCRRRRPSSSSSVVVVRPRRLYLLSSHVSTLVLILMCRVSNNLRTTGISLLSSHISTYRTNCTYEKASITSKQNMAQIYVGTVIEFPVRLLGGIVKNNVKLIPRLAED